MSIYIFEPAGGSGTTPNLQQVLTAGSTLTTPFQIDVNASALSFLGDTTNSFTATNFANYTFGINDDANFQFGSGNKKGVLFYNTRSSADPAILHMQQADLSFNLVDNFFVIDPLAQRYILGDYSQLNDLAYLSIENNNLYHRSDIFEIREANVGAGLITIKGSGYTSVSGGSTNAGHLMIEINGTIHYIALKV